jgi:molecular chaperone GrpE (heat shock protein)
MPVTIPLAPDPAADSNRIHPNPMRNPIESTPFITACLRILLLWLALGCMASTKVASDTKSNAAGAQPDSGVDYIAYVKYRKPDQQAWEPCPSIPDATPPVGDYFFQIVFLPSRRSFNVEPYKRLRRRWGAIRGMLEYRQVGNDSEIQDRHPLVTPKQDSVPENPEVLDQRQNLWGYDKNNQSTWASEAPAWLGPLIRAGGFQDDTTTTNKEIGLVRALCESDLLSEYEGPYRLTRLHRRLEQGTNILEDSDTMQALKIFAEPGEGADSSDKPFLHRILKAQDFTKAGFIKGEPSELHLAFYRAFKDDLEKVYETPGVGTSAPAEPESKSDHEAERHEPVGTPEIRKQINSLVATECQSKQDSEACIEQAQATESARQAIETCRGQQEIAQCIDFKMKSAITSAVSQFREKERPSNQLSIVLLIIIVFVFLILCFVLLLGVSYRKNDEHEDRPEKAGNKGNRKWNWLRFPQKAQNENQHTSGEDLASTHSDSAATTNQGTAQEKSSDDQSKLDELEDGYRFVHNEIQKLEKQNTELSQKLDSVQKEIKKINQVHTKLSEADLKRIERLESRLDSLEKKLPMDSNQVKNMEEKAKRLVDDKVESLKAYFTEKTEFDKLVQEVNQIRNKASAPSPTAPSAPLTQTAKSSFTADSSDSDPSATRSPQRSLTTRDTATSTPQQVQLRTKLETLKIFSEDGWARLWHEFDTQNPKPFLDRLLGSYLPINLGEKNLDQIDDWLKETFGGQASLIRPRPNAAFDHHEHQTISSMPRSQGAFNVVHSLVRAGIKYKGDVVRKAEVIRVG